MFLSNSSGNASDPLSVRDPHDGSTESPWIAMASSRLQCLGVSDVPLLMEDDPK